MDSIKVFENQSVLDIAIQTTGDVANAFAIAVLNNISITANVPAGTILMIPTVKQNEIQRYYAAKNIKPATAITAETIIPAGKGIGWMQIGKDFKVS